MPTQPPRACVSCGRAFTGAWCPSCPSPRQRLDRWRGSATSRGYTHHWHLVAADFRARFPYCGQRVDGAFHAEHSRCVQAGQKNHAQCVDHIRPLRDGGSLDDEHNLQSLCFRCNRLKG
jgi:5-methylcytosine-specific restriction endonuclease McrA